MKNSDGECRLSDWLCANTDLVDFLVIRHTSVHNDEPLLRKCKSEQKTIRNRLLGQISDSTDRLMKRKTKLMNKVDWLTNKIEIVMRNPIFPDATMNMELRVLFFAELELRNLKLEAVNLELAAVIEQIDRLKRFLEFFRTRVSDLPTGTVVELRDDFFENSFVNSPLLDKVHRLECFIESKKVAINSFEKPLWTSNFPDFFEKSLSTAISHTRKGLSYALPIPQELELEKWVFYGSDPSVLKSMDEAIDLVMAGNISEFVTTSVDMCVGFIPDLERRSFDDQSVASMFYYRILYNRLYERCSHLLFERNNEIFQEHFMNIIHSDITSLKLPFHCEAEGISIRDYFLSQRFFYSASLFVNELLFTLNPFDAFYFIHRALVTIQKATLMKTLDGKEATFADLNQYVCFDDLFSCLVGVVSATDIPDLFSISTFIEKFGPRDCLTSSFEYAQATVTALLVYFTEQETPA